MSSVLACADGEEVGRNGGHACRLLEGSVSPFTLVHTATIYTCQVTLCQFYRLAPDQNRLNVLLTLSPPLLHFSRPTPSTMCRPKSGS